MSAVPRSRPSFVLQRNFAMCTTAVIPECVLDAEFRAACLQPPERRRAANVA
jgi:hypothetical protein